MKLDAAGKFAIDDFLTPVQPTGAVSFVLPRESPVLLIRSGAKPGQGVWFAAGIATTGLTAAN